MSCAATRLTSPVPVRTIALGANVISRGRVEVECARVHCFRRVCVDELYARRQQHVAWLAARVRPELQALHKVGIAKRSIHKVCRIATRSSGEGTEGSDSAVVITWQHGFQNHLT